MAKQTEAGEPAVTDELKFSEREIAIAQGNDPDTQIPTEDKVAEPVQTDEEAGSVSDDAAQNGVTEGEAQSVHSDDDDSVGDESDTWLDEDVVELGSSYGLTKEDLESFGSREEFDRAARMADSQLAESGRQSLQQQQPPAAPVQQAQPTTPSTPPATPAPVAPLAGQAETPELNVQAYIDEGYDENTVALVKFAKAMQTRLDTIEPAFAAYQEQVTQQQQQQQETIRNAALSDFHDALDDLDPDLFGKTTNETGEQTPLTAAADANRKRMYEEAGVLVKGIQASGKAQPSLKVLLKRAHQYAFAAEIKKREQSEFSSKVAKQSKRRRSSSGMNTRGKDAAPVADGDEATQLANHPELSKLWNKFQDANGTG